VKSWFLNGVLPAAIGLLWLSSTSWAGGTDDFGCSNATLKGEYAVGTTAYTPSGFPNGPPQVIIGVKFFDGKGNLTQRGYTGDSVPAQFSPPAGQPGAETGTYHVNPDCTGKLVINLNVPQSPAGTGVITALFVISDGGRHIHEVTAEFIPPFSFDPVPMQTSIPITTRSPRSDGAF
jgi:hypothetical protein